MPKWLLAVGALSWISSVVAAEPHPQSTYGALSFHKEAADCVQEWLEDEAGNLQFKHCGGIAPLFAELENLDETDPLYEKKKTVLIELIDANQ